MVTQGKMKRSRERQRRERPRIPLLHGRGSVPRAERRTWKQKWPQVMFTKAVWYPRDHPSRIQRTRHASHEAVPRLSHDACGKTTHIPAKASSPFLTWAALPYPPGMTQKLRADPPDQKPPLTEPAIRSELFSGTRLIPVCFSLRLPLTAPEGTLSRQPLNPIPSSFGRS